MKALVRLSERLDQNNISTGIFGTHVWESLSLCTRIEGFTHGRDLASSVQGGVSVIRVRWAAADSPC